MNTSNLRDHYKRLLEAAEAADMAAPPPGDVPQPPPAPTGAPAGVPVEQDPSMQVAPDAPELQTSTAPDADPQAGLARAVNIPRFTPNTHRYAYMPGEVVNFYDDNGDLMQASIVGPPSGDRFDVVDESGSQHEVIKSELFYPAPQAVDGVVDAPVDAPPEDPQQ